MRRIASYTVLWGLLMLLSCDASEWLADFPDDSGRVSLPLSEGIQQDNARFRLLGYQRGDKVPDFTLFTLEGKPFTLYQILQKGKPLLLITGSYTCDHTRSGLAHIQALHRRYGSQLDTYLIYTLEAHPADTVSPYSAAKQIWTTAPNRRDSVEANQPRTYGQRKALARHWRQRYGIEPTVLMDSPDNAFWLHFGQAPNMVYLIEPDGRVYYKQEWFEINRLALAVGELLR